MTFLRKFKRYQWTYELLQKDEFIEEEKENNMIKKRGKFQG